MQGLIVAAGQGSRLRAIAPCKPLAKVGGTPLIQSVIVAARAAGVDEFVVVTGYQAPLVEAFLSRLAALLSLRIETVFNPGWEGGNGLSVAAAGPVLAERFLLMMSDHLFEPGLPAALLADGGTPDGVTLAVDRRLDNPLVDLADVTRAQTSPDGRILRLGKLIEPFDAFDTGVFLASHALIDAIEETHAAGGSGSITDGMNRLAERGLARAFDIGERFWFDIDDPVAHAQAERMSA